MKEEVPEVATKWMHENGYGPYEVIGIANVGGSEKYSATVVYKGKNGKLWTKTIADFMNKMKPVVDLTKIKE